MNLLHRYSRYFRPGPIRVGVVIQEFIPQHERNRHQPELAAAFPSHPGIELLQSVYEQKSEQNHVLAHLRRRQNPGNPFLKTSGGNHVGAEGGRGMVGGLDGGQCGRRFEPEQTSHLHSQYWTLQRNACKHT